MPKTVWQAWDDNSGGVVFAPSQRCIELMEQGLLSQSAILKYEIEASTGEQAMTLHYQAMGFEPYKPLGQSVPCPNRCGGTYYPEGFGDCPKCGHIG